MSTSVPAILGGTPIRPDGPPAWPLDDPAVADALRSALSDGTWGRYHGPHTGRLCQQLAAFHSCQHVILCASGTAAIELALRGAKVGPGDEVVLAAYDFKANFQNVLTLGATPVLVDVRPENWNIDVERLEEAIAPATRAIIVSHLHGGIVAMPRVQEIADRHGIAVIEDACQAHGAMSGGRTAGTWGDVGVLSFGGSKLLTAGRGGAILTNDADIVQRIRLYTQRGNEAYPLSELQAAVLLPQLEQLDERNGRRFERVRLLVSLLEDRKGLVPFRNTDPDHSPLTSHDSLPPTPSYYKLGLQYDPAAFDGLPRDTFAAAMRAEGVALDTGFRSLHAIHSRRRFRAVGELTHAAEADRRVLTLHHPVLLGSEEDLRQVIAALDKVRSFATMIGEGVPGLEDGGIEDGFRRDV
ncbi:MAG TPA: DegT/DnrJ/EryC1/StrS family aminotransferase [Planctomycetaceae bacterium]|nr:DegT/DnrJ/EryC1/StrS family aminotransferase [Planctomycetaceae bacterium]